MMLGDLHSQLELSYSILERQSKFLLTFAKLTARHCDDEPRPVAVGNEHAAVKMTRDFLESHYAENVSLDQIAKLTNLSSYHLIRVFKSHVGLPHTRTLSNFESIVQNKCFEVE